MQQYQYFTYKFEELPESAQQQAIDNLRDINVDYQDWCEFVLDDAKEIGRILGIEITDIFYSGFSSQGDGACFTGRYDYAKGAAKTVREYAPKDETLHAIADRLQDIQRRYFYQLGAEIKHGGRYSHEYCTEVSVFDHGPRCGYAPAEIDDAITECLRDFMRWIYRRLETEYWYLVSDESVKETILANEYEFTDDGRIH